MQLENSYGGAPDLTQFVSTNVFTTQTRAFGSFSQKRVHG